MLTHLKKYIEINVNNLYKMLFIILILITFVFVFSPFIIPNLSSPLSGWTGTGPWTTGINHDFVDLWEYIGYYCYKNLSFSPFPTLELSTDQVFYPYGVNSIFQPWAFERDLFYAFLFSRYGNGPWLKFYFLITILIAFFGAILLLKKEYGFWRASSVGILISFCNFYAINKFPHHLNICIHHWTVLSIITDFLIVKRFVSKQNISLKLVLVRLIILFLLLGQDLGYVAGYGLMSFTLSIVFVTTLILRNYQRSRITFKDIQEQLDRWKTELLAHKIICLSLLVISLLTAFLYVPLAFQILITSRKFDFSNLSWSSYWVNPFRIILPLFPGINSPMFTLEGFFHDRQEALFDGSPGLFFVLSGLLGLWFARDKILMFIPLILFLIFCLIYYPQNILQIETLGKLVVLLIVCSSLYKARKRRGIFIGLGIFFFTLFWIYPDVFMPPTLKVFPWFSYNRVGGRSTEFYPVIFSLFALHINWRTMLRNKNKYVAVILSFLIVVEVSTAYSFRLTYKQPEVLSTEFMSYMNRVGEQPGEAVLDWPFCIQGNGDQFCPYGKFNSGIFAMRRFHGKKVMGQVFGRLHPDQVKPYLDAGWDHLFVPNEERTQQERCFSDGEWKFFIDFYIFNDFSGINLYTDRFSQDCVDSFYSKFGLPITETSLPSAGKVVFIPKSSEQRKQVSIGLGKEIKLSSYIDY